MDIIDCIFEDNTVPMSAVYHVGGGPLLSCGNLPPIFRNNNAEERMRCHQKLGQGLGRHGHRRDPGSARLDL